MTSNQPQPKRRNGLRALLALVSTVGAVVLYLLTGGRWPLPATLDSQPDAPAQAVGASTNEVRTNLLDPRLR